MQTDLARHSTGLAPTHGRRRCRAPRGVAEAALACVIFLLGGGERAWPQPPPVWGPSRQLLATPGGWDDAPLNARVVDGPDLGAAAEPYAAVIPASWNVPPESAMAWDVAGGPGWSGGALPAVTTVNGATAWEGSPAQLWQWRILPEGVIYPAYAAGVHESRISGVVFQGADRTSYLDVTLGGRVALWRYGTAAGNRPEGLEFGMEGAAFPRLNLDSNWDVDAVDFRFGGLLTYGEGPVQWKAAFYHLSAHMGDELAIRESRLNERINFSRDALVFGVSYFPLPAWRWYAEAGFASHFDGGARPWEFQFGVDVSEPGPTGPGGSPFAAINGHLRQEHNYGGNLTLQLGWLWRGESSDTFRLGFHYFNGKTNQFEFYDEFEQHLGAGIWYDY
ncbi:MAG: DUF1207 domain-containing protein [Planctomycetales bacterium]|nr:DUF1207 domain-containing protein [Planctomycetales bacterium]